MIAHAPLPPHADPRQDHIARTQAALRQALANLEHKPGVGKRVLGGLRRWSVPVLLAASVAGVYAYRAPIFDWAQEQVAKATGAQVQRIVVEGALYTKPAVLKDVLALEKGDSLVAYNTSAARERLEELPWVRLAAVEKQLPSTVRVTVYEHVPLARLDDDGEIWVLNKEGEKIQQDGSNTFADLPLLHGDGAPQAAAGLFSLLATWPNLNTQLEEATYVGGRRWDLSFKSGVIVKLPEQNPQDALMLLEDLEQKRHVLALPAGVVDLRVADRIVLQIPDDVDANPVTNMLEGQEI